VKNDFEISQSDAFAIPGFRIACRLIGLLAESGLTFEPSFAARTKRY